METKVGRCKSNIDQENNDSFKNKVIIK